MNGLIWFQITIIKLMIIKNTDKASTARAFYNSVVLRPTFINNVFSCLAYALSLGWNPIQALDSSTNSDTKQNKVRLG